MAPGRIGAEALAVGRALGFDVPLVFGAPAEAWRSAAAGDAVSIAQVMSALKNQAETMAADGMSGTLQDLRKERPTEVEFFNGFIAAEGKRAGLEVSANATVAAMIREAEDKRRPIGLDALPDILARSSSACAISAGAASYG